jgi:Transposase IS116/IS110/IS902 family
MALILIHKWQTNAKGRSFFSTTPEKLISWAGLCPSGNSLYLGRMKYGNKKIRWILIQTANTAARKDNRGSVETNIMIRLVSLCVL